MVSLEKRMILTPLQKLPYNVGDLGKIIVATGFEWLPKVQNIARSGHTDCRSVKYCEKSLALAAAAQVAHVLSNYSLIDIVVYT